LLERSFGPVLGLFTNCGAEEVEEGCAKMVDEFTTCRQG
jgi:hypothetical protein